MSGLIALESSLLHHPIVKHGFFTRQGGKSEGVFSSLNIGFEKGDPSEIVFQNYEMIGDHFGISLSQIVVVKQVHGTNIKTILGPEERWPLNQAPEADAIVTTQPNFLIGVKTADCAPVIMMDEEVPVIAVVHAGWRGAVSGLIQKTIHEMVNHGARLDRIKAAIGPCIHQESYEVGEEVAEKVPSRFLIPLSNQHALFDLPGLVHHFLIQEGVRLCEIIPYNTALHPDLFFSCRRALWNNEPHFGVQLSAIMFTLSAESKL